MIDFNWSGWNALAALGQLAAAVASFIAIGFVGWQIRAARKTSDFQNLLEFVRSVSEREHALLHADSEPAKRQAFYEFLNFLEVHAAALNARLLPKASREIIRDKLIGSVVVISETPAWQPAILEGITSPTTFVELRKFAHGDKRKIDALTKARAADRENPT